MNERPLDLLACTGSIRAGLEQQARALLPSLKALRRHFHLHPELSGEEEQTAAVVAARLEALGLEVQADIGGHGVVGVWRGAQPGPVLAYRADMDALPIRDKLTRSYRSLVLGVKHACGHDLHMAVALGVAEVLASRQATLPGTVKFIFQPSEESLDGARAMIAAGVLEDPQPQAILALHAFPLPVGQVGLTPGICLAGMEEFRVRFYAPAGNLQLLVERAAAELAALGNAAPPGDEEGFAKLFAEMASGDTPRNSVFVSCWPHAGMPGAETHLMGLVSMPDFALREELHARIRQVLDDVTATMGAAYELAYTFVNPPLQNAPHLVRAFTPLVEGVVGPENVRHFQAPYPFAHEDFALYTEHIPGALLWLGTANPAAGIPSLLHTADYDVDEEALVVGTHLVSTLLLAGLTPGYAC